MNIVPRALGLFLVLAQAIALGVQVTPTSPAEREARPGELITHVFRVEGDGGPYPVRVESSAGFPVLSNPPSVTPPRFLPISEQVPEDALEGTVDVLTVWVGEAHASVRVRVLYVPKVALEVPSKVRYVPPAVPVSVQVKNEGNGPEHILLRLYRGGEEIELRRLELGPGEGTAVSFRVSRTGVYRVEAEALRGKIKLARTFLVERPKPSPFEPFSLHGQFAFGYSEPGHGYAVSFSLRGALSDYVTGEFMGAYARGGVPLLSLALTGEGWAVGAELSQAFEARFEVWEGPVRARLMAGTDGPWARADLFLTWPRQQHQFTFEMNHHFFYNLTGHFALENAGLDYRLNYAPRTGVWSGGLGYARSFGPNRLQLDYQASYTPGLPLTQQWMAGISGPKGSAGGQISAVGAEVSDWSVAAATTARALWGPRAPRATFGLQVDPESADASFWAELSRAPEADISLDAGWRWEEGAYLNARARLDLPPPFGALVGGLRAEPNEFSTYLETEAEPPMEDARLALGGRIAYPGSDTTFWGRLRFGTSVNYLEFSAKLRPFLPSVGLGLSAGAPLGQGIVTASAYYNWPEKTWGFSLGGRYPLYVTLPESVSEFFGGRKLATIVGQVLPDAPFPDLEGIKVVAGSYGATTDASGRFVLRVPPGDYTLRLIESTLPPELVAQKTEVKLALHAKERREVVFPVSVRGQLLGRVEVVGEGSKGEHPRFAVEVENEEGRRVVLYTEPDGSFALPSLRPGIYRVRLVKDVLPEGYVPLIDEVQVRVRPGAKVQVLLQVKAPEKQVFVPGGVQILRVEPEAREVPPGSMPLLFAEVKGKPERLYVRHRDRVVGFLTLTDEPGRWQGRVAVPGNAKGTLSLYLIAEAQGVELRRYPFFVNVNPRAPWGKVRTLPMVRPGQKGVKVRVHLYAPAESVILEVGGVRYPLKGGEADWEGYYDVPPAAGERLQLVVRARLVNGREVSLVRFVWVR